MTRAIHRLSTLLLAALVLCGGLLVGAATPAAADTRAGTPRAWTNLIAAGHHHSCVITATVGATSGEVRCWGANDRGQLGQGDTIARGDNPDEMGAVLAPVDLDRPAIAVVAGGSHTCALLDNSTVKCWGSNQFGQLGLGDVNHRGDAAGEMGASLPTVNLGTGRTAVALSAGEDFTCARLDNGALKCWGRNQAGQLGRGDTVSRGDGAAEMGDNLPAIDLGGGATAIGLATGYTHACAILDSHALKCWGNNATGQLGLGDAISRGDGPGEMGSALPAVSMDGERTPIAVVAGRGYTCAQVTPTWMTCWGENNYGQLGRPVSTPFGDQQGETGYAQFVVAFKLPIESIAAMADSVCANAGGYLYCWGRNQRGQLAHGSTIGTNAYITWQAKYWWPGLPFSAVTGSGEHFCILVNDPGVVRCVGANEAGQLGRGDTADFGESAGEPYSAANAPTIVLQAVPLFRNDPVAQTVAGADYRCIRFQSGVVKCAGSNQFGKLGLGNTLNSFLTGGNTGNQMAAVNLGTGRTAVWLAAAANRVCAVLDNGALKCWGQNVDGGLGLGDTNDRGDGPNEMGDNLPSIALGTGRTALEVGMGASLTCARLDNGTVKCWGQNNWGQLGQGDVEPRGDGPGEMGDALPAISLGTGRTAQRIAVGDSSACVILDTNQVKCWGYAVDGQLGSGWPNSLGSSAAHMGDALPVVALGAGRTATDLVAAGSSVCALLDNATLKCWGLNGDGQLGRGNTTKVGAAGGMGDLLAAIPLGAGRSVTRVSMSDKHVCVLLDNGGVKCWGRNVSGQLGLNDTVARGDTPSEMGDSLPFVSLRPGDSVIDVSVGPASSCALLQRGVMRCWGSNATGILWSSGMVTSYGTTPVAAGNARPMSAVPPSDVGGTALRAVAFKETSAIPTEPVALPRSQAVLLTWNPPTSDGFSPITGYRIEMAVGGGSVWTTAVANTASTSTTHQIGSLTNGQSYRFRVAALNAEGASAASVASRAVIPQTPQFTPLSPFRLADTRPGQATGDGIGAATGLVPAGGTLVVQATGRGGVLAGVAAVALNVTAAKPTVGGWLTVYACDETRPLASNLNVASGAVVANAVIAKVSATGTVCVYSSTATHVIVDVNGMMAATGGYAPVSPFRLVDTRPGSSTGDGQNAGGGVVLKSAVLTVQVAGRGNVPAGATAAVLNVTAVKPALGGFFTVYPCGEALPLSSSLNAPPLGVVSNAVVTRLSPTGTACILTSTTTNIIVDVNGAFAPGSGYAALSPFRLVDTRFGAATGDGIGGGIGVVAAGDTLVVQVAGRGLVPVGATAALLNLTSVRPPVGGWLTVYPCDEPRPTASALNVGSDGIVANMVVAKLSAAGTLCVYSSTTTDLIVDVSGAL